MKESIEIWISQAEKRWLEQLNTHVEDLFSGTFLPSHDHTHHLRVWKMCRRILKEISLTNSLLDRSLVEGVMIAAFFHDTGMVRSTDSEHGSLGREICQSFFREIERSSNTAPPSRLGEVLEAIEKHDTKDPEIYMGFHPERSPGILGILSVADDMEAFGLIGIYRYSEIYLKRGISMESLGFRIIKNASERFRNISNGCACCRNLLKECGMQHDRLASFFDMYNQQLLQISVPRAKFSGHVGVINYIRRLSVDGTTRPELFLAQTRPENPGKTVTEFFTELKNELEGAHG